MFSIRDSGASDDEYAAMAVVEQAVYPDNADTAATFKHRDEQWDQTYLRRQLVVEWAGKVVAFASYNERPWSHAPGNYGFNIAVQPQYERQGIGTAVYNHIYRDLAQQIQPLVQLNTQTRSDKPQSIRFLEKRGFVAVMRWIVSVLDVRQFDVAAYQPLRQTLAESGVQIRPLSQQKQRDPNWAYHLYELDWELIQDEPQPSPPTKMSLEQYVKTTIENPNVLAEAWYVAVENGRYVGMTKLYRKPNNPTEYGTGFTGVVRSHRRRGLATALKTYGIEYAQQQGIYTLRTGNEEKNPMYLLNVRLGFAELTSELAYEKKFGGQQWNN
jgi:GNAT superfamily N-acetyltransferase